MKETVKIFEQHTPYQKFSNFKETRNHYVDLYWKLHGDTWDKDVYFPFKDEHVWDKISDIIDEIITKNHCFDDQNQGIYVETYDDETKTNSHNNSKTLEFEMPLDKTKFKIKCELDITKSENIYFLGYLNHDANEDEKKKINLQFSISDSEDGYFDSSTQTAKFSINGVKVRTFHFAYPLVSFERMWDWIEADERLLNILKERGISQDDFDWGEDQYSLYIPFFDSTVCFGNPNYRYVNLGQKDDKGKWHPADMSDYELLLYIDTDDDRVFNIPMINPRLSSIYILISKKSLEYLTTVEKASDIDYSKVNVDILIAG